MIAVGERCISRVEPREQMGLMADVHVEGCNMGVKCVEGRGVDAYTFMHPQKTL